MRNSAWCAASGVLLFFTSAMAGPAIPYGNVSVDADRIVPPNTQAVVDTDTRDLYWFRNSITGYDLVRVPFRQGRWDESRAKKLLELGKRTVWYTRYDSRSKAIYLTTDEKNDEAYDVFRIPLRGKARIERVSASGYTFGYDLNRAHRTVVYASKGKSEDCLEEVGEDGKNRKRLVCGALPGSDSKVFGFFLPKVSADGDRIVFGTQSRTAAGRNGFAVFTKSTGKVAEIYAPNAQTPVWGAQALGWVGSRLYVVAPTGDATKGLYAWDARTPSKAPKVVTAPDLNVAQGYLNPDGGRGLLLVAPGEHEKMIEYDFVQEAPTASSAELGHFSPGLDFVVPMPSALDARTYAVAYSAEGNPYGGVALFTRDGSKLAHAEGFKTELIDGLYPSCEARHLTYVSKTSDGASQEIEGYLYIAKNPIVGTNSTRAIVYTHGGPSLHEGESPEFAPAFLCRLGYPVFAPNVRGSDNHGQAFQDANNGDWGGKDLEDYLNARKFLAQTLGLGVDRIGFLGWSYGGFMALSLATNAIEPIPYAVALSGFADLSLMLKLATQGVDQMQRDEMGDPAKDPAIAALYRERSPSERIANVKSPVLVIHGLQDPRVPWETTKPMIDALRTRGTTKVETALLPGEGHLYGNYPTLVETYRAIAKFLFEVAPL